MKTMQDMKETLNKDMEIQKKIKLKLQKLKAQQVK
jgi:hypothetical protein